MSTERAVQVRAYLDRAVIIDSDREIDRICAVAVALGVPVLTYDRSGFSDVPGLETIVLVAPAG